jgi:hypothetical protein
MNKISEDFIFLTVQKITELIFIIWEKEIKKPGEEKSQ